MRFNVFNLSCWLNNYLFKWSCDFIVGNPSLYFTMLLTLVASYIVVVKIDCFWFVTWPQKTTCLKGGVTLQVEAPQESHSSAKFCSHTHCRSGGIMVLVFTWSRQTTWSKDNVALRAGAHKGKYHVAMFGGHGHTGTGDMFLVCHVTWTNWRHQYLLD